MKIRLTGTAERELEEALTWYAEKAADLELKFLDEVSHAKSRIVEHPNAWHPLGAGIRRFRLDRFPYGLIYLVTQTEIVVVAIAHLHREPDYWRDRLPKC